MKWLWLALLIIILAWAAILILIANVPPLIVLLTAIGFALVIAPIAIILALVIGYSKRRRS